MKVSDFARHIRPEAKGMLKNAIRAYQCGEEASLTINAAFGVTEETDPWKYHFWKATLEAERVKLLVNRAFDFGYLSLEPDKYYSDEEASIALLKEIREYLELVEAGIESFVATHPIQGIADEAE
ncbi:MAG: hypothetical protein IKS05_09120 [Oscillospiraceae bacterium]|nr:hypothetical protein [Oscillospiraceae bacterium]